MDNDTTRISTEKTSTTDDGAAPAAETPSFGPTPAGSGYGAVPGPWSHDPIGDPYPGAAAGAATGTTTKPKFGFFRRSRTDRMVAGVCGGLGKALDVDAALIRVGLVLLTVFGVGAGALAYLVAWILVPEED
jgi:phage shock protein C